MGNNSKTKNTRSSRNRTTSSANAETASTKSSNTSNSTNSNNSNNSSTGSCSSGANTLWIVLAIVFVIILIFVFAFLIWGSKGTATISGPGISVGGSAPPPPQYANAYPPQYTNAYPTQYAYTTAPVPQQQVTYAVAQPTNTVYQELQTNI
jgi:hypothetical protein